MRRIQQRREEVKSERRIITDDGRPDRDVPVHLEFEARGVVEPLTGKKEIVRVIEVTVDIVFRVRALFIEMDGQAKSLYFSARDDTPDWARIDATETVLDQIKKWGLNVSIDDRELPDPEYDEETWRPNSPELQA